MRPTVFWPAAAFAFVLGLGLAALGMLAALDPEGRGGMVFRVGVTAGVFLAGASVVAVLGRMVRWAWRRGIR